MIGRQAPLRALRAALEAAVAGRPSVWLVAGEAGIGKTRLVAEVEAAAAGFTVLHGEGVEFGGEALALGPFVAALRGLGELPHADGPGQLYELVLDRLRDAGPVLLVLEDLHWADRATLALLAFLARNLRSEQVVVVATYRVDDELPEALRRLAGELVRRPIVTRIVLEPLARDEVAQLVEAIAGGPVAATLVDDVHARAGGNPFFVEELFAARTATLEEAVRARVARLDERMLAVLAAAGGHAGHALLEQLDVDPEPVRAGLDAGVLAHERDGVAFRHGLIGEVLYARLLPSERVALHRALAAAVEDPAQRAHHCERAGLRAEAVTASLAAGAQAAAVFAYDAALRHYERALELGERSVDVLARAAQAARHAGRPERAVALCREAIELSDDPVVTAHLYERLGEFHFWDDEAALECYDRALALVPGEPRLLAAQGHALMGLRRWAEARERCEAGLAAGAGPRITLGLVLAHLGEPDVGEEHLARALELAETGEETARAYLHLGELRRLRGDHAGALAAMVDGEREAARLGLRGSFGHFMFVNGADDLLRLGRWEEAAERLAEAERMDLSRTAAALRRATAGLLHTLRGDLAAAHAELGMPDGDLPSEFLAPLAAARAALALAEGDPRAARAHVAGALERPQDVIYTPPLYWLGLRAEADAAGGAGADGQRSAPAAADGAGERRSAAAKGAGAGGARGAGADGAGAGGALGAGAGGALGAGADGAGADALLASLEELIGAGPAPPVALAHLALARAEHARARGEPAPERWSAAATAFDALAEPYPAAYARLRAAEALLRMGGDRREALEAVAAAHRAAGALGAAPLVAAVEALARRARLRIAPAPPDDDGTGLTAREVEVLRLLADGLTNREIAARLFISQKTVSAHMAHIYGKLGVHTRVDAAAQAQRLGVLEDS